MAMIKRKIFSKIHSRLLESRRFIQVLLGPRQVGKTTLVNQLLKSIDLPSYYTTADSIQGSSLGWIQSQWDIARTKVANGPGLLVIDEIQKISNWSAEIKSLWDEDTLREQELKVILLGSSPWLMQKGLTESLAGRFEIIPVTHWSYDEMREAFNFTLEDYMYFGGYPGGAKLIDRDDNERWLNYINDSLIETAVSRDILQMTRVNKPALLRRLFHLGCIYSSKIVSYQKLLGQLQDAGNTTTLAHYAELLEGAGLLATIPKFSKQELRQRASPPKFQAMNTALITAQTQDDFKTTLADNKLRGHLVESTIGAYLLNAVRGKNIEVCYWREGNYEVDFVLRKGNFITAIEVKSSPRREKLSGLQKFKVQFNPQKILLVGGGGISVEEFLLMPIEDLVS